MSAAVIPESIAQLQLQLDQIRSTQPRGKKLPDSVWQAAVELAREHGVYSVAHHLRLDEDGVLIGGVCINGDGALVVAKVARIERSEQ